MPLFDEENPLTREQIKDYQPALECTQGNILKSHGRHHTINAFLTFHGPLPDLKKAIQGLAARVTSAWQQTLPRPQRDPLFAGFGLSAAGYECLGHHLNGFSDTFRGGMLRGALEKDPDRTVWDPQFPLAPHAMILLAHADKATLDDEWDALSVIFKPLAHIHIEPGDAICPDGPPVEHFGFLDGISQPLFFKADVDKVAEQGGIECWDPSAGPNLVLVRDPRGKSEDDCGSYFVFRKLEQDVDGFRQKEKEFFEALRLNNPDVDPELAGAMAVGRFRNGTPVAAQTVSRGGKPDNNFSFQSDDAAHQPDRSGRCCPFSSHIRKVNPRGDTGRPAGEERMHRIARRGIPYGNAAGNGPKGLLFQCCQARLENQFELIQSKWCDEAGPPSGVSGFDPVAGHASGGNQQWPSRWGFGTTLNPPFDFGGFVKLKGGSYFFIPSLTFLQNP